MCVCVCLCVCVCVCVCLCVCVCVCMYISPTIGREALLGTDWYASHLGVSSVSEGRSVLAHREGKATSWLDAFCAVLSFGKAALQDFDQGGG